MIVMWVFRPNLLIKAGFKTNVQNWIELNFLSAFASRFYDTEQMGNIYNGQFVRFIFLGPKLSLLPISKKTTLTAVLVFELNFNLNLFMYFIYILICLVITVDQGH